MFGLMVDRIKALVTSWPKGVMIAFPVEVGKSLYFVGILPEAGIQEVIVKKYVHNSQSTFVIPKKDCAYKGPKFRVNLVYAAAIYGPANIPTFAYFVDLDDAKECYKARFGKECDDYEEE